MQPKSAAPDNTKTEVFQVFGEKSKDGQTIAENAQKMLANAGMTENDLMSMVMGSAGGGMGGGGIMKSLKGLGGGLKGLAGKIGGKGNFPQGYGAPQSPSPPKELPAFIRKRIQEAQPNPLQQEAIKQQQIKQALDQLFKPNTVIKPEGIKGMRKVGVRG